MNEHIILMQLQLIAIILCTGFGTFYITVRFFDPKKSSFVRFIDKAAAMQKSISAIGKAHDKASL